MKKKKTVLIVTANDYLVYQPTILNLYDFLDKDLLPTIISFEPHFVSKKKDETRKTIYIKIPLFIRFVVQNFDYALFLSVKFLKKIFKSLRYENTYFQRLQLIYLKRKLKDLTADIIIAVDIPALFVTQQIFSSSEFLSLEIYPKDRLRSKIDLSKINSVFIQNEVRYQYLFNDYGLKRFIIQNAPVFKEQYVKQYERRDLVWAGSILMRFAVLDCIRFVEKVPDYKLVLKGGGERKTIKFIKEQYAHMIANGTLKIDQGYLDIDEFIDYLSHFRIGFCFYSWDLINSSINYQTAPSGKLFMCLAAGVPVIACDIPGFSFIKDFKAGVLIDNYEPETIKRAIDEIEANYFSYSNACYQAARHFNFESAIKPYINYLLQSSSV